MIQLTRLNSAPLAVNSDLIKLIEEAPDTVLTLISGEKLVVRETMAEIIERVRAFRRSILCRAHLELTASGSGQLCPPPTDPEDGCRGQE